MKPLSLLTILITITVAFTSFNKVEEWVTFNSKEGKFSVLLPSDPKTTTEKETEGPGAPYSVNMFISQSDKEIYLVGYVDYAPDFEFEEMAELNANRDNFVKAVGGEIIETKNVKLDSNNGIFFTAKTSANGYLWTSYVYLVGKRPYQLVLGSPEGKPSPHETKFFSSFKLTP